MDDQKLKELAIQKEKEWLAVMQERLVALERTVEAKDEQLNELNQKYRSLSEDFKYNLRLIEERDKELSTFDQRFKEMKKHVNEKNAEISELKIVNDQLLTLKKQIEQEIDEEKKHFLHRLTLKEKDLSTYKKQCDEILQIERENLEKERRTIQRRVIELENDLERQRRELTQEFDGENRRIEFETRRKHDELAEAQLSAEIKCKLLTEELNQNGQTIRKLEEQIAELVENIKNLRDADILKSARIKEFELRMSRIDEREEDFSRKCAELDRNLREKDVKIDQLKRTYEEAEDRTREANDRCLQLKQQMHEQQRENDELLREKTSEISTLQDEINRIKKEWNYQLSQISKEHANENVEHQNLRDEFQTLKNELKIKENHVQRYKKELEDALDRERALEEAKAQLDLDWQKKFDRNQRDEYHKSEDLIEKLSAAHEQALAQVKKLENDLRFKDELLGAYANQKNSANLDGLVVLQRENESLRTVVAQMRQQMESLMNDLPSQANSGQSNLIVNLQNENENLRKQNRDLIDRLDSRSSTIDVDHTAMNNELKKNPQLNSYVQSLNNTIASLRTEKLNLISQVRKLEGRLIQIEKNHENFQRELRQRQARIDQLTYQINADDRRHQTELTSSKQKIADLEVLLLETRQEADEYQKAIIERNGDVAELERKLSEAKLELAGRTPLFNYGGQEILIQQLQDEIQRLTKEFARHPKTNDDDHHDGLDVNQILLQQENEQLKRKIDQLNQRIQTLIRDKERLLEISNNLRAQLHRRDEEPVVLKRPPIVDTIPTNVRPVAREKSNLDNKLERLEKLQYALTRQELENRKRPVTAPEKIDVSNENPLMNSGGTVTTIASENIRDLWKVLDNTPGKETTKNLTLKGKALKTRPIRSSLPGRGGIKGKVRNWNARDDDK